MKSKIGEGESCDQTDRGDLAELNELMDWAVHYADMGQCIPNFQHQFVRFSGLIMGGFVAEENCDQVDGNCLDSQLGKICGELQNLFLKSSKNKFPIIPLLESVLSSFECPIQESAIPTVSESEDVDINKMRTYLEEKMKLESNKSVPIEFGEWSQYRF